MSAERLHFEPGRMAYHGMLAAEHVVRYRFAAGLCRGRRVLDVACGEGYGTRLLADAGAASVVGVDISAEAIGIARARFAAPNVRFLQGDATRLTAALGGEARFDVIVSYETIEHVDDVDALLAGIAGALAPGGTVVISCPNEADPTGGPSRNPFHRRAWSLAEFQAATTARLGPARMWFLGTPVQGLALVERTSPLLGDTGEALGRLLEGEPVRDTILLPAQASLAADDRSCAFFVGVWGDAGSSSVAVSPVSRVRIDELWQALEWLRAENARLLLAASGATPPADTAAGSARRVGEQIADVRRAALLTAERLEASLAARRELEAALAEAQHQAARLQAALAASHEIEAALAGAQHEAARLREALVALEARAQAAAAREAALAADAARLREIEASGGWRAVQAYARLLARPVAGAPLRALRAVAVRLHRQLGRA